MVSVGDVLTFGKMSTLEQFSQVYNPYSWDRRKRQKLENTYNMCTVYCWVITNIKEETEEKLHNQIYFEKSYLGAIDLNYSYTPHFSFFANGLILRYRLHNHICYSLYSMNDNQLDVKDEVFSSLGYQVSSEDIGARHTIFDNYYDSLDHHKRIDTFTNFFENNLGWDHNDLSELNLNLEELHPYLFNIFYAATQTFQRAEIKEQLSQSYLSGRRFIEHLTNFLYPPKKEKRQCWDGKYRDIKEGNYVNRISAYVEETLDLVDNRNPKILDKYGKNTHSLYEDFCKGIHKPYNNENNYKEELVFCSNALSSLGRWLSDLIALNPSSFCRPYLAYNDEINSFVKNALKVQS